MITRAILICLLLAIAAQADNVYGPNISGIWTITGSPYIIMNNVTVPGGQFLTIMPGVDVRFNGEFSITVNGGLAAHGAAGDSIRFRKNGSVANWLYIKFSQTSIPDSCLLEYCNMEGGANAVWANGARVTVRNSHIKTFTDAALKGSAYFSSYASLTVSNGNIHNNGKGISLDNSSASSIGTLNLNHCNIYYSSGVGILLEKTHLVMDTCTVYNSGGSSGHGVNASGGGTISISGGSINNNPGSGLYFFTMDNTHLQGVEISDNGFDGISTINCDQVTASRVLIHHNHDNGMQLTNTSLNANNLTISSNGTSGFPSVGSGISSAGASVILSSSIVDRNQIYGIYMQTGSGVLTYNDTYQNGTANYFGCSAGDGSIQENPMYVSIPDDDFNLQAGSPCIDTGSQYDPLDPDGTRTDMGALYYFQNAVSPQPNPLTPSKFHLLAAHPNPFNPTTVVSFDLRIAGHVKLTAWDTSGRLVTMLINDWRSAGTHEIIFDGSARSSGTFFMRLEDGRVSEAITCTLIK
jgi:hypothetical protein